MSNFTQISIGFGATIFGINMLNYRRSPVYKPWDPLNFIRILFASGIKGTVYSFFFPVPIIDMIFHFNNEEQFNRHFIPLSVYGLKDEKQDKQDKQDKH